MNISSNENIKNVYIHVGIHKTGTTSIQKALSHNSELLLSYGDGYLYPKCWVLNHSIPITSIFTSKPEEYHVNIKQGYDKTDVIENSNQDKRNFELEIINTNCKNIIISGEDISILNKDEAKELYNFIKRLMPSAKIEIIMYVREITSFIASLVQQQTKTGSYLTSDDKKTIAENLYRNRIEKFLDIFGHDNVSIYKFEDTCKHVHGPVGYFMEAIGFDNNFIKNLELQKSNESISYQTFELCNFINKNAPLIQNNKIQNGRFHGDLRPFLDIRGTKYSLPYQEASLLQSINYKDAKWLMETTGIDYINNSNISYFQGDLVYNKNYYEDIIDVLRKSSVFIIRQLHLFYKDKELSVHKKHGKKIISFLVDIIEKKYSYALADVNPDKLELVYNNLSLPIAQSKDITSIENVNSSLVINAVGNRIWFVMGNLKCNYEKILVEIDIECPHATNIMVLYPGPDKKMNIEYKQILLAEKGHNKLKFFLISESNFNRLRIVLGKKSGIYILYSLKIYKL